MIGKFKLLLHPRYSPLFKEIIQTLLIFILVVVPLSLNIIVSPPPYTITNQGPSGYSEFKNRLGEVGYSTTRTLLSIDPVLDLPPGSYLFISDGSRPYSNAELMIIDGFVSSGGILVVIADSHHSRNVANYFGVRVSPQTLMETNENMTVKAPDVILLPSPDILPDSSLCMIRPKEIVSASPRLTLEYRLKTSPTVFLDANSNRKWDMGSRFERLEEKTVGAIYSFSDPGRHGFLIVLTSSSFLTNDLYNTYSNVDLFITLMLEYSFREGRIVAFEESHKGWPIASTEGIINQGYGNIIYLSRIPFFILGIIVLVIVLFILTPRFKSFFKPSDTYKRFLSDNIWNREQELYDTFAATVQPTIEESTLSTLYFQWELLDDQIYTELLKKKLSYIPEQVMSEDEINRYRIILHRKIDHATFLSLIKELESIQKRRWL